jgi:hypothetical protein
VTLIVAVIGAIYPSGGNVKNKFIAGASSLALVVGLITAGFSSAQAAVIKLPLAAWPACTSAPTSLYCIESVVVSNATGAKVTLQYVLSGQAPKVEAASTGELFAPMARIQSGKVADNAWWMGTTQRDVFTSGKMVVQDLSALLGSPNHPDEGAKYDAVAKKYDINRPVESYGFEIDCWNQTSQSTSKMTFSDCYKGSVAFLLDNEVKFFWYTSTAAEAAAQITRLTGSTFIDLAKLSDSQVRPTIGSTYDATTSTFSATEPMFIPLWVARGAQDNGWTIAGQPTGAVVAPAIIDTTTATESATVTELPPTQGDAIGASVEAGTAFAGRWTHSNWAGLGLNALGYDGLNIKSSALGEYQRSWLMADVIPAMVDKDNKVFLAGQPGNNKFAVNLDADLNVSIKLRIGEMIPGVTFAIATGVTVVNAKTSDFNTMTISGSPVTVPLAAKPADCKGETGIAKANVRQFQLISLSQNDDQSGFGVPGTTGNMFVGSNGVCELSTPVWNETDKTFTWKVAAPHFAPDGITVNRGFYKAVIPAADAALLWGLTNPNDAASALEISLETEESGSTTAFTKNISVKNGNIIIDIAGFKYSRPKLKIGIKATYKPAKAMLNKSTITCTLGKSVKKITAVKPTCPKGYIKKK